VISYKHLHEGRGRRWGGLLLVCGLHVGLGAALMGQKLLLKPKPTPTEVAVIRDFQPKPPEPDPPARPLDLDFRPTVVVPAAQPPDIQPSLPLDTLPPRAEPLVATSGPDGVRPAEGPPPAVVQPPTVSASIGLACPHQVAPEMPGRALQRGVSGSVRARLTIRDGRVVQLDILSAQPRGYFEEAVRTAVAQYRCLEQGAQAMVAEQVFQFTAED
jgi:protein TonB